MQKITMLSDKLSLFFRKWIYQDMLLISFISILLVIVWVSAFWLVKVDETTTLNTISLEGDKFCRAFEEHVRQILKTKERYLSLLKINYERSYRTNSNLETLVSEFSKDPLLNQISIINDKGEFVISARPYPSSINLADVPHFRYNETVNSDMMYIGKPIVGKVTHKTSIHMAQRLNYPDGSFAGIAVVATDIEYFKKFFNDLNFTDMYVIRMVGTDGVVRTSNFQEEIGVDFSKADLFDELKRNPSGFYYTSGKVSGKRRYINYRLMSDYPIIVQVGLSEAALAPLIHRKYIYLGSAIVLSISMTLYTIVLVTRSRQQRQAEKRYRMLLKNSFDGIALVDAASLRIVEINNRFVEAFGYRLENQEKLSLTDFIDDIAAVRITLQNSIQTNVINPNIVKCKTSEGRKILVEYAGSYITMSELSYYLLSFRVLSPERKKERELLQAANLAHRIQKALLPQIPDSDYLTVETFYRPVTYVSGDTFHLTWLDGKTVLHGCILDVVGHGIATALQTAALNVLLHDAAQLKLSLKDKIELFNQKSRQYFDEGAFAAAIAFELDMVNKQLRYVSAGINEFYYNGQRVVVHGSFIGMDDIKFFGEGTLDLHEDDTVCFISDGLSSVMQDLSSKERFSVTKYFDAFRSAELTDDATAIALKIHKFSI